MQLVATLSQLTQRLAQRLSSRLPQVQVFLGYSPQCSLTPPSQPGLAVQMESAAFSPLALGDYLGQEEGLSTQGRKARVEFRLTLILPIAQAGEGEEYVQSLFEALLFWDGPDWLELSRLPLEFHRRQQAVLLPFSAKLDVLCLQTQSSGQFTSLCLDPKWKGED